MKLVREHINEKFTETGDPIEDMGIGIGGPYHKIEKVLKELKKEYGGKYRLTMTPTTIMGVYKFDPNNSRTKHIIRYDLQLKKYYQIFPTLHGTSRTLWSVNSPKEFAMNAISELKDDGYLKESVNEKFTEKSDPIEDMNIGITNKLIKNLNTLRQLPGVGAIEFANTGNVYFLRIAYYWHNYKNEIIQFINHTLGKDLFKSITVNDYDYMKVICTAVIKPAYNKVFKNSFTKEGFIKRSLNEKFTEESDPVQDLGIGMEKVLKEYIEKDLENHPKYRRIPCRLLSACAIRNNYDLVKYLIKNKKVDVKCNDHLALRSCAYPKNYEMCKFLIELGEDLDETINDLEKRMANKKYYGDPYKEHVIFDNLLKLQKQLSKKKVNEKFTQDSDPLEDLSIGVVNIIFEISKKGYSFRVGYYSEKEWRKIVHWMLEEYEPWEVLACLDNKIMRYAYDNAPASKPKATLNDFQKYNVKYMTKQRESEMDRVLRQYQYSELKWANYYQDMAKQAGIFKEPLHEKFTEKGDPIKDMGIGVYTQRTFTNIDDGADFMLQILPAILGTDKIPDDIIIPRTVEHSPYYRFEEKYFTPIIRYVKKYIVAKPVDALWLRSSILTALVLELQRLGYPKKIKEDIKESINEKFTEEGDPVHDLGIGGKHIREFDTVEQAANFFLDNIDLVSRFASLEHLKHVMKHYNEIVPGAPSLLKEVKDFLDGWDVEYPGVYGAIHIKELGVPFNQQQSKIQYLKDFRDKVLNKIKRRSVNEKFTEEPSDPISDMGIGGYTFETLKPGAIIKAKRIGIAVTKNQSGQFTSWHSGLRFYPESLILVYNVTPRRTTSVNIETHKITESSLYKDILFKKFFEEYIKPFNEAREELRTGKIPHGGITGRMIVSKKMFDNRFEVIERGF